jgi:hypothetical protein
MKIQTRVTGPVRLTSCSAAHRATGQNTYRQLSRMELVMGFITSSSVLIPVNVGGRKLFVCSTEVKFIAVLSENLNESAKFIKFLKKKIELKTSSRQLKLDFCQTNQHIKDRLTP